MAVAPSVYDRAMMHWLANVAYAVAAILYLPVICYQMVFQGKNRRGWRERLGYVGLRPARRGRIWIHAVSLGEVNATPRMVAGLSERFPDREIVISSTTDTGHARACELYGAGRVFRFPLDFSWVVRRVLDRVAPDLLVLVELEVWYNLVRLAAKRGVRVAVVNGRLTEHSARKLTWLGNVTRQMFGDIAWVGALDADIAARFERVGVEPDRIRPVGSLKWDTAVVADTIDGADALAEAMQVDRSQPLWVCGSTGPGEESIVLDAYRRLLEEGGENAPALAVVPRKPERFDEVARLIEQRSFACVRRSRSPDGGRTSPSPNGNAVFLVDTMGELRKLYALATVIFVGRSLVPMGGSDPMEAAALGKPILAGPHMENFREPADVLGASGALRVVTCAEDLAREVRDLCVDPAEARRVGVSARTVVQQNQGATDVTVNALAQLLEGRSPG